MNLLGIGDVQVGCVPDLYEQHNASEFRFNLADEDGQFLEKNGAIHQAKYVAITHRFTVRIFTAV